MRSLIQPQDRAAILARLHRLGPDMAPRWGRMTAPQMVCHLTDSFRGVLGERASAAPSRRVPRWRQLTVKFVALYLPVHWPHGMKTRPAVDQEAGGTPPGVFADDVAELTRACERFAADRRPRQPHYLFGDLSPAEWARWGYRHMDHHLRQFGL